jgi:folate-dependent phosphoribosylglycinamide formyltransferase PurN
LETAVADERHLQQAEENMDLTKTKIVVWCGGAPNQKALANKIAATFNLAGIVIDSGWAKQKKNKRVLVLGILWDRLRFYKIYDAWSSLMKYYNKSFSAWPQAPTITVQNINDEKTEKFTKEAAPDIIVVSGTALIKEPLISIKASIGIINLHTGLSPYVKGGPNCTNWCIANNTFHLVGNTIMWLNGGIDAGNIITTENIDIRNCKNLKEAHLVVMEHAHDLYLKAIGYLCNTETPYNSVPQRSIDKGSLYLTKMWTAQKKMLLLKNWRKRKTVILKNSPKTVSLTN